MQLAMHCRASSAEFTIGKTIPSGPTSRTGFTSSMQWPGTRTKAAQPPAFVARMPFWIIGRVMPACSLSTQMKS